ncbi:MAG: ATP-binding protein [Alphaproteobacteria bacterium]|nr:MAG: ATP-binding protein [Alphaproteobacteria bacterium]
MVAVARHLEARVVRALAAARVINIFGPRQAGKTTLVRDRIKTSSYVTLDADDLRQALAADAYGQLRLLARGAEEQKLPLAIDEVQRLPSMTLALKQIVDTNDRKGQFLLTGSSNVFTMAAALDSLAGRVMSFTLRPLSAAEIHGAGPVTILDAVARAPEDCRSALPLPASASREEMIDLMVRGGFPEIRTLAPQDREDRYRSYMDSVIERDVAVVEPIRKPDGLRRLTHQIAYRTAGEAAVEELGRTAGGLRKETVNTYLTILEKLELIRRLGAWASGMTRREIKRPKLHLLDTGLATVLRGEDASSFGALANPTALGAVLETFVYTELEKSLPLQSSRWSLYHYRDDNGHEVDILAEAPGNILALFEIKAAAMVSDRDFKHLDWFFSSAGPGASHRGVAFVVYLGDRLLSFGPRRIALPLSMFWSFPPTT